MVGLAERSHSSDCSCPAYVVGEGFEASCACAIAGPPPLLPREYVGALPAVDDRGGPGDLPFYS